MQKHLGIFLIIDARTPVLLGTSQCHLHQVVLEVQCLMASALLIPLQPLSLTGPSQMLRFLGLPLRIEPAGSYGRYEPAGL